jgi:hypothetical protein
MKPIAVVILGLVAAHVSADFLVSRLANSSAVLPITTLLAVFGFPLSQACLVPLGYALSQRSQFWRFAWLGVRAMAIALCLSRLVDFDVGGVAFVVASGIVVLATGLLARLRGCRIQIASAAAPVEHRPRPIQFSVAELLGLTAFVAVGTVGFSMAASWLGFDSLTALMLLVAATLAAATCWVTAWFVLGRARLRWRLLAVSILAVVALASSATSGLGIAILFGVEGAIIGATLLPLRFCGFRIVVENRHNAAASVV